MILVADAGGTKTDWRLLDGDQISPFVTIGYNPNTHQLSEFIKDITPTFLELRSKISKLYFYGASLYPGNDVFIEEIGQFFSKAQIEINTDLLGSCRALSANESGFVGILGTGSAGCFYEGNEITNHLPSLGYSLGDEGSGAYLGRKLLNKVLRNQLGTEIQHAFEQKFHLSKEEIFRHIYNEDGANAYLASFSPFLLAYKSNPQVHRLIMSSFQTYFNAYFMGMEAIHNYPFHFTGSVAYHFSDFIREVGTKLDLTITRIVQSPIAGLALYHQSHE